MLYICVRGVMDAVFSVCIVTRGAVGARVWEVWVFCHSDVVCLCLVCICQFSMIHYDCLIGCHECRLLFTPSYCCECFYHLWWLVCLY